MLVRIFFRSIGRWVREHKAIGIIAGVLVAAGIVTAILLPRAMRNRSEEPVKKINTVPLSRMDLTSSVSATGTIESARSKTVSANISNITIRSVKVEEGDRVKKGQKLVTFDESDLQEALSDARENLSDARAQAASEISSARRQYSQAETTYKTQKKKLAKSVASARSAYQTARKKVSGLKKQAKKAGGEQKTQIQSELEKAEEEAKQAKSNYEQARNEQENSNQQNKNSMENAEAAIDTARTNTNKSVREAEKSVEDAAEALEQCSVTAPIAGIVTAVAVESGDTYNGGDLFEISDCTNLQVSTTVSEYDITKVEKGQKVVILTDATDEDEFEGEITYVAMTMGSTSLSSSSANEAGASTANAGSSDSSGYEVRIRIKKKDARLRVGMTAKCSIILEEAGDVYAVPYDAVHSGTNGESLLYVMDTDGAQRQVAVTQGMESDYYVEVSGDELNEDMQVILPSDAVSGSSPDSSEQADESELPGMMGGMGDRSERSGGMPGGAPGGMSGGGPGM